MSNMSDLNRFSTNPTNLGISRSMFNRNHSVKFSCNVGDVIPFLCEEILPGDSVSLDTSKVVRLQPLVTPIMDEVYLDTYYFFVPNRLIWSHWINFMGENTESAWTPSVEYVTPKLAIPSGGFNAGTIADYFGVPINQGAGVKINALPFRAYALICDQWFRDENNMNPVNVNLDDSDVTGVNTSDQVTDIVLGGAPFIACKLHDYFTSCLPGAQKGTAVSLPLGSFAPLSAAKVPVKTYTAKNVSIGDTAPPPMAFYTVDNDDKISGISTGNYGLGVSVLYSPANVNNLNLVQSSGNTVSRAVPNNVWADISDLTVDLSNATASTVNQLRQAFAIQKYFERLARGGSRYIEQIKAQFNVTSPDARLQRSEYLGGNRVPLNVSQVEQTSATEESVSTPQGNVVGMSVTGDVNSDFTKSFTEHGYLIGVCVARYKHTYQNGLERHWFRSTVLDYYNPVFANLGEQAVKTNEIYLDVDQDDDVFGYQEAWADYRYKPSRVAGEMRSNYTTPLDMWHLADDYSEAPSLSDSWIREDKANLDRCLAVTSDVSNQLICDFYITSKFARPMPLYSIPGLIDHN